MNATGSGATPPRTTQSSLWFILALVAAGAFVVLVVSRREIPSGTEGPAIGRALPYLELEALTGGAKHVSLADLQGRVTLINYWGTWCPPCRLEFPHIAELAARFANVEDFRLYAISSDGDRDQDLDSLRRETEAFLKSQQTSLPTYADPGAESRRAMVISLGLDQFGFPTTLVLDRRGKIRGYWTGYERGAERAMQALVEELLAQPAAPAG